MARRKGSAASGLGMAVLVALAAVAVAGPFLIAGWCLFNELRALGHRGATRVADLISDDERTAINGREQRVDGLARGISQVMDDGDRIGLDLRADGAFDGRNRQGREFNRRIEALLAERAALMAELEQVRAPVERRIEAWLRSRSSLVGARTGLVLFVSVFSVVVLSAPENAGRGLDLSMLMFGSGADSAARIGASLIATLAAAVGVWIASAAARASLAG